ncbi:MAG: DNA repair protein RecN, partial [Hyphomicrobium sp.]
LADALSALDRAVIEAAEAEDALERARAALSFDPARLEEAEARLFEIRALARKHRIEADALPALREALAARLDALQSGGAQLAALETDLAGARDGYDAAAAALREARRDAAGRLDAAVMAELAPLKLDAARFRTALTAAEPSASGADRVEFEVATNPGAPFGPLTRIASGGELSRFILALKVALHQDGGPRTIVFDEIDRGVGGAVASAVGERLHRLAASGQVLVVTHSPQVAARGATHLLIEKSHDGTVTRTGVRALDPDKRREEIARMLSGAQVTDEARAQAERLLEAA